jgi:hypothetical protein
VLREYFGLRRRKKEYTGDNYMKRSFIVCVPHQMLLGAIESRRMILAGGVAMGFKRLFLRNTYSIILTVKRAALSPSSS